MNKQIIGHGEKLNLLHKAMCNDRGHQSFLFSGPESVGKYTIARAFADNLIVARNTCEWNVCDRVDGDVSIIVPIAEEKKDKVIIHDISVKQIREASQILALAPNRNAKVLIIDEAHRMGNAAQNALLKMLEEPQQDRYIILVTDSSQQMLRTIHSRCFHVQFGTVDNTQLQQMYDGDKYIDDVDGRPGYLERMHTDEEFRENVEYARTQLQLFFQKELYERMQLATDLSNKNDEYVQIFLNVWIYRIRNAAHKTQKFQLVKVADRVEDVLHKIQFTNVNKKLILEDLFINMA